MANLKNSPIFPGMIMSRRTLLAGASALALPRIARADAALSAIRSRAGGFDQLHSLIVLKNGETLVEDRFRGPALDRVTNVKSVSKTIVATLLGMAIDRGAVPSVTTPLNQVAPRLIPAAADPRARAITLEHLVTLRAGLERTSGDNYGSWVSSGNWVANALSRPFVDRPGGRMLYSTGSTHVLGAALTVATGLSLHTMAREWLGRPLGIDIPAWLRDPQGYFLGGNDMALSPRAMVRFGEMIRQGGVWNGQQIVARDWVEQSFDPVTRSPWSGLAYGYGWFLGSANGVDYALARGYGGQVIAVAPKAGITVTITSDPNRPARSEGYFGDLMSLIEQDILGALA